MNTKNYCYPYASGYYEGLFKNLKYSDIPGVKVEDREKLIAWVNQELNTAEKIISDYSNKINNY